MNIAILSPGLNLYSETFIQAHKGLKGNIFFFYQGEIPKKVEGYSENFFLNFITKLYFKSIEFGSKEKNGFDRYILKRNLEKHKIHVGLAEYGTTGAECYSVFRRLHIPLIVHFHGYDASSHKIKALYKNKYRSMFNYAAAIIAVSTEMQKDLIMMGASPDKIQLIPYGPSHIFLSIKNRPNKPYKFLHVGRFTTKKAPINTIMAFKKCSDIFPNIRLLMVGEGELLNKCKELVKQYAMRKNVEFVGKKNPTEIRNIMKDAFAFVLHSVTSNDGDKEGTPVSVLEAMAAGLPVVSTLHAGIKDVVIDCKTGYLVNENDIETMADRMLSLVKNPDLAKTLGENGRKRVLSNYTIEIHLKKIQQLLANSVQN